MLTFIVGFLSSLLATAAYVALAFLFRNKLGDFFRRAVYQVLGIGIDAVYPNLEAFEGELAKLCSSSSEIKVLSFRGSGGCRFLFHNRNELKNKRVEVLVVNPYTPAGLKWIGDREREVRAAGYYERNEKEAIIPYPDMVKTSIRDLHVLRTSITGLKIYLYESQAIWTMYIFDNKVGFLGGYTTENLGRFGAYYKVSGKNVLLEIALRHFQYLRDCCATEYDSEGKPAATTSVLA